MLVKAAAGVLVPMEDHPRRYIDDTPADVPDTAYYRRRMADGDLIAVSDDTASPKEATAPEGVNEEARRGKR